MDATLNKVTYGFASDGYHGPALASTNELYGCRIISTGGAGYSHYGLEAEYLSEIRLFGCLIDSSSTNSYLTHGINMIEEFTSVSLYGCEVRYGGGTNDNRAVQMAPVDLGQKLVLANTFFYPETNGVCVFNGPNQVVVSGGNLTILNFSNPENVTFLTSDGEYATNAPNGTPLNDMQYGSAALTNLASGNGSGLTNLPAVPIQEAILSRYGLQIDTGTIHADAGPLFLLGETDDDGVSIHGDVWLTAGGYHGDGLDLTNLDASNLSSGTVPVERLPTNSAVAWAGKNIWAGDAIFTGTVSNRGATYFGSTGQASASSAGVINATSYRINTVPITTYDSGAAKSVTFGATSTYTNTMLTAGGTSAAKFSPVLTEFYQPIQASSSITATNGFDLPPIASTTTNLGALRIWNSNSAAIFVRRLDGTDKLLLDMTP